MSDEFNNKIKRKLGSDADETGRSVWSVRRIELIMGTGRRCRWASDDKARMVVESRSRRPVAQSPVTRDRFLAYGDGAAVLEAGHDLALGDVSAVDRKRDPGGDQRSS